MSIQDSENIENVEQQVQDNTVVEQPDSDQQENAQTNEEAIKEDRQASNIRAMRLGKERAEKERDEAYKLLKEMKASQIPEEQEEDLDISIKEDDLVEGKHLSKVEKKIKKLEQQLQATHQQTTAATVESQLKSKYNDFDKVVNKENVEALARDYPELGNTLRSTQDIYSQAVTAYTMIKRMGIYTEDKFVADKAKAEANSSKPRPLASVSPQQGDSPLTRANAFANGLTPELKEQLLKEMNEARSRM